MLQTGPRSLSARDACRILFRHRGKSIFFFLLVLLAALGAVLLKPRYYVSEAKLFVRLGRENVGIDPTATTGQTISLNYSRESEIASVQNLLSSRTVFEQVVDELGPELILHQGVEPTWWDNTLAAMQQSLGEKPTSPGLEREYAIYELSRSLLVDNPRKSHVFSISYEARSPELAQRVVETFLRKCREGYVKVHHNEGSYEFFVEQTATLQRQVQEATEALRDVKNRVGLVSVEGQRKVLEDHLTNLDKELLSTKSLLAAAQEIVNRLQPLASEADRAATAATGLSVRALDDMRNQLYTLQLQERDLLTRFSPVHPKAISMREQVRQAERLLQQQELAVERSNVSNFEQRVASLERQYHEAQQKLQRMNQDEVQLLELQRKVNQLTDSYMMYMKNKEQARIDQALESQRITNLAIVQEASLSQKPLSRKGLLIMALAVSVGLLGGVGLAFLSESLDDSVRTPRELEAYTGLPVLMSVPHKSSFVRLWK